MPFATFSKAEQFSRSTPPPVTTPSFRDAVQPLAMPHESTTTPYPPLSVAVQSRAIE
ncbi:MAG: hypothetical protein R3F34_03335 [Planctomycetota bacterium]